MDEERWYEVKDIVEMLNVHEQTVRRWIRQGDLEAVMLGRKGGYRVKASDLEAFLEAQRGKAAA